jgi:hypothetical protein
MRIEAKNNLRYEVSVGFDVSNYNLIIAQIGYKIWDKVWLEALSGVANQIYNETRNPILTQVGIQLGNQSIKSS